MKRESEGPEGERMKRGREGEREWTKIFFRSQSETERERVNVESSVERSWGMDAECAYRYWKDDSILPKVLYGPLPQPTPCFYVQMRLCNKLKKLGKDDAVTELVSVRRVTCSDRETLLAGKRGRPVVYHILSWLCLPDSVKESMMDEILQFARSMLDDEKNKGREVLAFVVDVEVTILQMPGESEDDAIARAGNKVQESKDILRNRGRSN